MSEMLLAVVGAGRAFERLYAPAVSGLAGARIAAIADPRPTTFGATRFASLEELLDQFTVNAVVVLSPPPMHAEHVLTAIKRGCPVLVEKPPALHAGEVESWLTAGGSQLVTPAFSRRTWLRYRGLRRRLGEGETGRIVIHTNPAAWGALGGGEAEAIEDLLPHCLDLARWISGAEIRSVSARPVAGGVAGQLRLDGGRAVSFEAAHTSRYLEHLEIDGIVHDERPRKPIPAAIDRLRGRPAQEVEGTRRTLESWLRRLAGLPTVALPGIADAWACAAAMDACRASQELTSATVELPPAPPELRAGG